MYALNKGFFIRFLLEKLTQKNSESTNFRGYVHSSLAPCLYLSRKERQGTMVLRRVTSHCLVRDFPSGKNSHVLAGPLAQDGIVVLHEGFSFGMPEASLLCTSAQKGTHKGISFPLARRRENYPSERTIPFCGQPSLTFWIVPFRRKL